MTEPIGLAEWIAGLRSELTEAVRWQEGRKSAAQGEGVPLRVPSLLLKELRLEVTVITSRNTTGTAGARGGLSFHVFSAELSGQVQHGTKDESTQRVTLLLVPEKEVALGPKHKKASEMTPR
jgi:hypothetical protein